MADVDALLAELLTSDDEEELHPVAASVERNDVPQKVIAAPAAAEEGVDGSKQGLHESPRPASAASPPQGAQGSSDTPAPPVLASEPAGVPSAAPAQVQHSVGLSESFIVQPQAVERDSGSAANVQGTLLSADSPEQTAASPGATAAAASPPPPLPSPLTARLGGERGDALKEAVSVAGSDPGLYEANEAQADQGHGEEAAPDETASVGGLSDVATEMSEEDAEGAGELAAGTLALGGLPASQQHEQPLPEPLLPEQPAGDNHPSNEMQDMPPQTHLQLQQQQQQQQQQLLLLDEGTAELTAAAGKGARNMQQQAGEVKPGVVEEQLGESQQAHHADEAEAAQREDAEAEQEQPAGDAEAQQAQHEDAANEQAQQDDRAAGQAQRGGAEAGQGVSLLQVAEEMERRLASDVEELPGEGGPDTGAYQQELLVASLVSQLEAQGGAGVGQEGDGYTDERGTVVGRHAAARAFLSPPFEVLFKGPQQYGMPSVVTKYRGMVAVGTSSGSVHVLMPATKKDPQGQPRLAEVSERPSSGAGGGPVAAAEAVTALCFGQHGGGSLLMLSGHASGALKVWELKTHITGGMNWALSKSLSGVHGSAVTACAVLEGGPTTWALSADAHGRLMCHNLSKHLSVAAQALTSFARQLTGAGSIPSHLISLQAAGQDPGVILGVSPLHLPQRGAPAGTAGGAAAEPQPPDLGAFVFVPDLGHFVLLCASRAVLLCLLTQEGRMHVLHVFLPPLNTPADCTPYAAWHLETPPHQGVAVSALVAVAWQASISVYRTVLLWRRPVPQARRASQSEPQEPPQPLPPPVLLNTWAQRNPVCGITFLESAALLVAVSSGQTATELLAFSSRQYADPTQKLSQPRQLEAGSADTAAAAAVMQADGGGGDGSDTGEVEVQNGEQRAQQAGQAPGPRSAEAEVERLLLRDWVVGSQVVPTDASTYHNALACFGEQALLLTSHGVRVAQLLTWQQRLSALVAQGHMRRALLAAVNTFHAAAQTAGSRSGQWLADGAGANPQDVSRQLLTILCGLVDNSLAAMAAAATTAQAPAVAAESTPQWLAEVCIATCLLLGRPDALLSDVFPRWQPSPFLGSFLEQLEPHILRDQLPSLAPEVGRSQREVMQALVEHFVSVGQPERVERCVLKMDILSLDLNQLIPLCLRHRLYGALLHIFTGAMQDYQTPASLLLVAAAAQLDQDALANPAAASSLEAGHGTGLEVRPPPAAAQETSTETALLSPAGAGEVSSAGAVVLAQHEGLRLGYRLLVFLQCCLLGQSFPPGSGEVPPEQQHAVKLQAVAFLLYATALSVWECWRLWLWGEMAHAEDAQAVQELPAGIADPHPALRLLCRMDAGAMLGLLRRALLDWDALEADLSYVVPSVAQHIPAAAAGDRTMTQAVIDAVVELIQTDSLPASVPSSGEVAAAHTASQQSSPPGASAETVALQFVADHLASNRAVVPPSIVMRILSHLAAPAQQAQQGQQQQQAQREGVFGDVVTHAFSSLGDVDRQEAVWLARRGGFLQAEARIRNLEGGQGEALACLVRDTRHPHAPFKFARELLTDPGTPAEAREAVQSSVMEQVSALMALDPAAAAQLVLDCLPGQQQGVLRALSSAPRLQLAFLRSLLQLQQRRQRQEQQQGSGGTQNDAGLKGSSRDPALQPLLADMSVANLFVELLCQFEQAAVLPFLQSYDSYGVDECLRHCLRHRVQDGAAFLLERRGDVQSALKIYIQALDGANRALVEAMRRGGEAVEQLVAISSPVTGRTGQGGQPFGATRPRRLTPVWAPGRAASLGLPPSAAGLAGLPELHAAQESLRSAIAVCIRYSQDRLGAANGGLEGADLDLVAAQGGALAIAANPVQRLWFQVLQGYVVMMRELRKEEHQLTGQAAGLTEDQEHLRQRLLVLQQIFTGFMEEVIRGMAGHVPMKSIAEAIIHQYGSDHFGDFKSTLLGLLGACNFELSILQCANRVMGSDGARILASGYQQCSKPAEA
ncbi:hypothetical protein N2152v2_005351 [Parachlorella kessleri]